MDFFFFQFLIEVRFFFECFFFVGWILVGILGNGLLSRPLKICRKYAKVSPKVAKFSQEKLGKKFPHFPNFNFVVGFQRLKMTRKSYCCIQENDKSFSSSSFAILETCVCELHIKTSYLECDWGVGWSLVGEWSF